MMIPPPCLSAHFLMSDTFFYFKNMLNYNRKLTSVRSIPKIGLLMHCHDTVETKPVWK